LLTGFTQLDDDDDVQIHNVIRPHGCHRVMFKANITSVRARENFGLFVIEIFLIIFWALR